MKYQNVILMVEFTLQDKNVKCDVDFRIKIILHAWLDYVQIKKTSNHIQIAVKHCRVKTGYLNANIRNDIE